MSLQSKKFTLFPHIFFFTTLLSSTSFTSSTSNPSLQFPCNPPTHNHYPFCNTTLPITTRAQSLISLLTLEEKIHHLTDNFTGVPRLGVPNYEWWSESLHGIASNGPGVNFSGPISSATSFPQVILTAATFNRSLWHSIASVIAVEGRAMYNLGQAGLTFWAPNVNVFRDPRWGRGQETPGEDPMVAAAYGVEFVMGIQGQGGGGGGGEGLMLSACCKHVTAYDLEKWGSFTRYNFNAIVTDQDMEDTYQAPFRSCVEEGKASCLMCSYNAVNGIPACAREDLLQKTRDEWGFKGYITSDCDAVATIFEYQNYTKSPEDAVALSLKAVVHHLLQIQVTDQDMEDTYQAPFRSCVEEGKASCLMCSYNAVNGIPACAREDLLQKTRDEWGFRGYITSDCDAVATIFEYQNYTKSPEDAVALSLKAGMDINCGTFLLRHTQSAINQGKVTEKDIDRALFNLFSVQLRLGLFDGNPIERKFGKLGPQHVCSLEHRALALEAAKQGIVLLKNVNKFLPLQKTSISSLAIIGPMANTTELGGGYTGVPCSPKSILDAFQEYGKKTSYASGCLDGVPCNSIAGFPEAIALARDADIVIVVVGLDLSQETEDRDRYSLLLPGYQMALVTEIAAVSKQPLVLVLTGGGPLDVSFAEGDPRISSILWIGYPGETGGKALVDVVFGDYNPGGRLPVTWYPESFTNIPMNDMNMRADPSRGYPGRTYRFYTGDSVYGFGHGLSYTTFTYKLLRAPTSLSLSRSIKSRTNLIRRRGYYLNFIPVDELAYCNLLTFHVVISVTNEGDMDGSHVVMLYSRVVNNFLNGAPKKQLIGFDRVHTISNRSTEMSILVDPCKHLSIANDDGKRVLPLGDHVLMLSDLEHVVSVEL